MLPSAALLILLAPSGSPICAVTDAVLADNPSYRVSSRCSSDDKTISFAIKVEHTGRGKMKGPIDSLRISFAGHVADVESPSGWASKREFYVWDGTTEVRWEPQPDRAGLMPGHKLQGFRVTLSGPDARLRCLAGLTFDGGLGGGAIGGCLH
jgi:hypothetical protein